MDRLLVGDVGYGKTEVALRAAFKAIEAGKQVAFLVPTTILAQQHFDTMTSRFDGFPVNVAILSRFQTTKEVHQIIHGLEDGSVDIVVGTHRLLSKTLNLKTWDCYWSMKSSDSGSNTRKAQTDEVSSGRLDADGDTDSADPAYVNAGRTGPVSRLKHRQLTGFQFRPTSWRQNAGAIQDGIRRENAAWRASLLPA